MDSFSLTVQTVQTNNPIPAAILLDVPATLATKDRVARICELWWTMELPERETLTSHTISYLLLRSLTAEAKAADIKRVFAARDMLAVFDFDDIDDTGPLMV